MGVWLITGENFAFQNRLCLTTEKPCNTKLTAKNS